MVFLFLWWSDKFLHFYSLTWLKYKKHCLINSQIYSAGRVNLEEYFFLCKCLAAIFNSFFFSRYWSKSVQNEGKFKIYTKQYRFIKLFMKFALWYHDKIMILDCLSSAWFKKIVVMEIGMYLLILFTMSRM